jgi:hypothetical protein
MDAINGEKLAYSCLASIEPLESSRAVALIPEHRSNKNALTLKSFENLRAELPPTPFV